tara:strand:- start:1043 stop:1315 length:273 start_codon:yes stop_codon:yes gene_type:complete
MNHAVRIRVRGWVQGVSFRVSAKEVAENLEISGWVSNLDDGSVELHAEGEPSKLKMLIEWCWKGSPSAKVMDVELDWIPLQGLKGFQINY